MNRKSISRGAAILSLAALVASCSAAAAPLDVVLEAHWQCDVQRLSFTDLSALNTELNRRIATAGMTLDEYNEFKGRLSTSSDLRSAVSKEYEEYCQE